MERAGMPDSESTLYPRGGIQPLTMEAILGSSEATLVGLNIAGCRLVMTENRLLESSLKSTSGVGAN